MGVKFWIKALRLRTLPLALATTLVGSGLAYSYGSFNWLVAVLGVLTTLCLQILSNLANDYGDFKNGKDTALRIGPERMVHSGKINPARMFKGVLVFIVLSFIFGVWLIVEGTKGLHFTGLFVFLLLGLAAIAAAIKYTMGKNPYGYMAMGDVFVFLFFGLAGVGGTWFLHTHQFSYEVLLPASAIGFLSVGVLNLNNLRDFHSDKATRKKTLVIMLGLRNARIYHALLLISAFYFTFIYVYVNYEVIWQWLFLLSFPLIYRNIRAVMNFTEHEKLNVELKNLSLASLVFSLLFVIGQVLAA